MEYDADYYERGIETGRSRYQNYRWMPESTMSMAMTLIDELMIEKHHYVLDYGCAKGFLVKALRLLHRQAWGVDISEYAISKVDKETNGYCATIDTYKRGCNGFPTKFDICIAKDVFEHIKQNELALIVRSMPARKMFVVVPLGKGGKYIAPANDLDPSHVICEDHWWWKGFFENNGWEVVQMKPIVPGIKDSYRELYPTAHGFFYLVKK